MDALCRAAQDLLDRWYPGTVATVDWTGDAYLVQLARGFRLADPIWVSPRRADGLGTDAALCRELLAVAWRLKHEPDP